MKLNHICISRNHTESIVGLKCASLRPKLVRNRTMIEAGFKTLVSHCQYGSKSCLWTFLSQRLKSISNNIFDSLETTVWATSIQTILSLKIFPLAFLLEIPRNYTQPQCEGHPADTFEIAPIDLTLLVILFILKGLWRQTSRKPAPLKSSTVGDTFIVDLSSLNRWVSGEQLSLVVCSLFLDP